MDRERILAVLPHYAAMVLLLFLVLVVANALFGPLGFWVELLIVVAIALVYRPVVHRLGLAPDVWERQ